MTRLSDAFEKARQQNRGALVTYLMGGDPSKDASLELALAVAKAGADIVELGFPFSDPIADGPVIQRAAMRSLKVGTHLDTCLQIAASFRARSATPLVLMGYLNPVLSYGQAKFFEACSRSGVDGVIIPDLPPEEAGEMLKLADANKVAIIFMLAPTSTAARRTSVFKSARGFVYYVSVTGVTGSRAELPDLEAPLKELKAGCPVPVVVGFGISNPAQAKAASLHADGVVVGSALVAHLEGGGSTPEVLARCEAFVASLRAALPR